MNREREKRIVSRVYDKIRKTVPMNTGTKVINDRTKEIRKDRKECKHELRQYEHRGHTAFTLGHLQDQCEQHQLMYKRFKELWKEAGLDGRLHEKMDIRFGYFDVPKKEAWMRVCLYTEENKYCISTHWNKADLEDCYMGCTLATRKNLPTEDHTRGCDLPDGYFTKETLNKICMAILSKELLDLCEFVNQDKCGYVSEGEEV